MKWVFVVDTAIRCFLKKGRANTFRASLTRGLPSEFWNGISQMSKRICGINWYEQTLARRMLLESRCDVGADETSRGFASANLLES